MQYLTNKQHLFFWEFLHDTSINIVQKFAKERPYFRHYVIEFSKNLYQQIQSLPIDTAADKPFVIESLCIRNKHFPKISPLHFLSEILCWYHERKTVNHTYNAQTTHIQRITTYKKSWCIRSKHFPKISSEILCWYDDGRHHERKRKFGLHNLDGFRLSSEQ